MSRHLAKMLAETHRALDCRSTRPVAHRRKDPALSLTETISEPTLDTGVHRAALARAGLTQSTISALPRDVLISCGTVLLRAETDVAHRAKSMVISAQHAAEAASQRYPLVPAANLTGTPIIDAIGELNGLRRGMCAMAEAFAPARTGCGR